MILTSQTNPEFSLPQFSSQKLQFSGLFSLLFATTGQFKFTNLSPLTVEYSPQQIRSIVVCRRVNRHTKYIQLLFKIRSSFTILLIRQVSLASFQFCFKIQSLSVEGLTDTQNTSNALFKEFNRSFEFKSQRLTSQIKISQFSLSQSQFGHRSTLFSIANTFVNN